MSIKGKVATGVADTADTVKAYAKAFVGAIVAAAGSFQAANGDGVVTTNEWVGVGVTFLVAFGGVAWVSNTPKTPTVAD